ncbi:hypothetical protein [Thermoactinomyces mirandus]|uniref:hypothetical protein n=1 Tax=Thermoactinomyces mirandus TaxID=2756294 RepID=UPI0015EEEEA7|nr:hypothetical protein [Thermoactinomyces mirandus]
MRKTEWRRIRSPEIASKYISPISLAELSAKKAEIQKLQELSITMDKDVLNFVCF